MNSPGPAEAFVVRDLSIADVPNWYHVYSTRDYPSTNALTFAQGWGNTRFAPITLPDGSAGHTYYAASTPEGAYMESVLHDVSLDPPGLFEVAALQHYYLATIRLRSPLKYVSFHTPYLPSLALTRGELIDSLAATYPETRKWSQAAIQQQRSAQAIGYGSRRDDSCRCMMLVEQRLGTPPFDVIATEHLAIEPRRSELLNLVRSLNISEI